MKSGTLSRFFRRLLKKFESIDTSPSRFKSNLPERTIQIHSEKQFPSKFNKIAKIGFYQ